MNRLLIAIALLAFAWPYSAFADGEAVQALAHPGRVTIYSLEPMIRPAPAGRALDKFTVLGDAPLVGAEVSEAINAFRDAIAHPITISDGQGHEEVVVAACFEPRHAISVQSGGHTFDYIICYTCGSLEVFRDGKFYSDVLAGGSPALLNAMLNAKNLPLAASGREGHAAEGDVR